MVSCASRANNRTRPCKKQVNNIIIMKESIWFCSDSLKRKVELEIFFFQIHVYSIAIHNCLKIVSTSIKLGKWYIKHLVYWNKNLPPPKLEHSGRSATCSGIHPAIACTKQPEVYNKQVFTSLNDISWIEQIKITKNLKFLHVYIIE